MKASYYKNLLMVLMCLCLTGVHGEEHGWTNIQGQTIKAEFVSATNEAVTISMRGKNFEVKFTNLLPQSVALAKRLQGVVKEGLPVKNEGQVLGKAYSIPKLNLDMLWCKPGTFMMGSPESKKDRRNNETQYEVTLTKGFYLGKHEVTQAQWEKVMGSNPSKFKGATLPVEKVSWEDAMLFCEKLTQMEKAAGRLPEGWAYTLPTEAQWEYACRAGTTTATSFGNSLSSRQANFDGDSPYGGAAKGPNLEKTTAVGTYPANPWGFHDMHGNVWEWCRDWYGAYPSGSASDPVGLSDGSLRVYRGGGWYNNGWNMRSANRSRYTPDYRSNFLGFRLSLQTATAKTKGAGRTEAEPVQRATGVAPVPSTTPRSTAKPVAGKSFTIPTLNMDMLWCKPGTFMMGSPKDEKDRDENETQHKVTLTKGFWFGKHEVTIGQFRKFVESTGYRTDAERKVPFKGGDNTYTGIVNLDFEAGKIVDDRSSTWATLFASSEANPVLGVSWNDTVAFCNWLTDAEGKAGRLPVGYTYSLPAEAQWEYACRAGTTTATSFGDSLSSRQANFHGNYPYGNAAKDRWLKKTAKVGSYPANAWGFHDMHGNVWEWCSDWYGEYPNGQVSDPVGPSVGSLRVIRGGSWNYNGRLMRSANRSRITPDYRINNLGFRLSLQTEKKERSDP
jgi:formylglycine-generating enzyme required for sulfatase activity